MHPDDDSQTTLSKWPFILGDILLVAMALAIAMLSGWQLTDWQVGACVAAVALGAALFVLPYVVEFQVRVREEGEDRTAELRILEKHILSAGQALSEIDVRLRALESATAEGDQRNMALADTTDQKLAQLEVARASQEDAIQALQQHLKELPTEAPASPPEQKAPVPPQKTVAQIDRPKRSARERHGPRESRLLQRAISGNGDHSSAAVSRIIQFKAKEQKAEELAEPEESTEPEESELAEPTTPAEQQESGASVEPPAAQSAPVEETVSAEKPKPASAAPAAPSPEAQAEDEADESGTANALAEGLETLLEEAEVSAPAPRTKVKKNDAVLTASVFIGIGNKPFLRGSGGGLSWEQGVAMEFQEIGKWQWVAPVDLEATLEVQIFRNDEDPDSSGRYTLEPGQKLAVSPVFE